MRFRILFQCVFVHCRHAFLKISEMPFRYQLMRLRKTPFKSYVSVPLKEPPLHLDSVHPYYGLPSLSQLNSKSTDTHTDTHTRSSGTHFDAMLRRLIDIQATSFVRSFCRRIVSSVVRCRLPSRQKLTRRLEKLYRRNRSAADRDAWRMHFDYQRILYLYLRQVMICNH